MTCFRNGCYYTGVRRMSRGRKDAQCFVRWAVLYVQMKLSAVVIGIIIIIIIIIIKLNLQLLL
jgi:hypothetical protein